MVKLPLKSEMKFCERSGVIFLFFLVLNCNRLHRLSYLFFFSISISLSRILVRVLLFNL